MGEWVGLLLGVSWLIIIAAFVTRGFQLQHQSRKRIEELTAEQSKLEAEYGIENLTKLELLAWRLHYLSADDSKGPTEKLAVCGCECCEKVRSKLGFKRAVKWRMTNVPKC